MAITATTELKTEVGKFQVNYHKIKGEECVSFVFGDIKNTVPLVRIHSACLFGEAFHSLHCDCKFQLYSAMQKIVDYGAGAVVYAFDEGRGIGLEQKIKAMNIQQQESCDTVEAFQKLGLKYADYRSHQIESLALKELNAHQNIWLISGNPRKQDALEQAGFIIKKIIHFGNQSLSNDAISEKETKVKKLGYNYKF